MSDRLDSLGLGSGGLRGFEVRFDDMLPGTEPDSAVYKVATHLGRDKAVALATTVFSRDFPGRAVYRVFARDLGELPRFFEGYISDVVEFR